MKRTLLVPVVLLVHTLLFSIVIGVFVYLYEPPFLYRLSDTAGLSLVGPVVLGALLPAFIFTIIRSVLKPIVPWLFLVLLTVSAGLLLAGAVSLPEFGHAGVSPDPALTRHLPEKVILSGTDVSIRIGTATGVALSDVLIVHHDELPAIRHVPEGVWNAADGRLSFPEGESVSVEQFSEILWWNAPPTLRRIAADISSVFFVLAGSFQTGMSLEFFVTWAAFLLALTAVWTPARFFRWPLLNLVIALSYLRLVLAVPDWVASGIPFLSKTLSGMTVPPVAIVWGVCGVSLLCVSLFLPSLALWQREVAEEGGGE